MLRAFPFGPAVLAMAVLAVLAGVPLLVRQAPQREGLITWIPSQIHAPIHRAAYAAWPDHSKPTVQFELLNERAMDVRLLTMFMGGRRDPGVPDIVQIEISRIGKFLRPPVAGVGLLPLDAYLDQRGERIIADPAEPGRAGWRARCRRDGAVYVHDGRGWRTATGAADHWRQRLLASRLAPWQKNGTTFGLPFDLHPVTLTWREDLWREVGVDPRTAATWPEFIDACRAFETAWRERGTPRAAMAWKFDASHLEAMLLQRGVRAGDEDGFHLRDPRVAATLLFYARAIAGPARVGIPEAKRTLDIATQLMKGEIAAVITPDWRVDLLLNGAPDLAGKLRMRALPVFEAGDVPTSTIGGSCLGITRACRDPNAAWSAVEAMLLTSQSYAARRELSAILPALPEFWPDPQHTPEDPRFGGQRIAGIFASLAPLTPARSGSPAAGLASTALNDVLALLRSAITADPSRDPPELDAWLAAAQLHAERTLAHGNFE